MSDTKKQTIESLAERTKRGEISRRQFAQLAGLVLAGIPLLWPYALLAFATICLTIYVALRFSPRHGQTAPIGGRDITQQAIRPDLKVALRRPAAGYAAHARALVRACARPGPRAVRVQER